MVLQMKTVKIFHTVLHSNISGEFGTLEILANTKMPIPVEDNTRNI
jgi:hypothetical protein